MKLQYASNSPGVAQSATTQSSTPQLPEEFTVDDLAGDEGRLMNVRSYMMDRLGQEGEQKEDEDNNDYVERFLTHMRSFENRSLELTGQIDYLRKADEEQRKQFLNAYHIYNKLPGFMSKGGGDTLSALGDYAYYNVVDPINLVGLGVGALAAKTAAKQGVKGIIKGLATYGSNFLTEGAIGAGMNVGLQNVQKEAGIRDEISAGEAATAGLLSGAGSTVLQGAGTGLKKAFDASPLKRDLKGELTGAAIEQGSTVGTQRATGFLDRNIDELAEFDGTRGREILDRVGDVKQPDLIDAEVKLEINSAISDVAEELFNDPTAGVRLGPNEKVSDALFRVLQDPDAIKNIDEAALANAFQRSGLTPEQFAQIYRTTVSDAAKQLNALSQLSKKLRAAGGLDTQAMGRLADYFDQKPTGVIGKAYEGALWLDRQRRALLVSQIPTLLRNASTTGIRGAIDTGANILDATAFYGIRKAQRAMGKDVPDYTFGMAMSDSFSLIRNAIDQDFSADVVKATIGNNPKLLAQISRSLTDVGDGSLAAPVRFANALNMTHDGLVRRAIYASSVEKQLRRVTGKGIAETLASNGEVPKEIVQQAVRESLEFTFANMPTGKFQNALVKTIEAAPFIGTGVFTFPRFTVAAFNFTTDYVLGGHLVKGGAKLAQAAATGSERAMNEGLTNLSKGIVGAYALFEAVAHRSQNQDVKWFEYKDDEGRTGDLRPFFPAAPYLLVADIMVKIGNGTLDRVATQDIIEGILGTRLAGSSMYAIEGFYKALASEGQGGVDSITGQRASEAIGGFLGELVGGPVNTNLITGLVRDIERTFITEAARMKDTGQTEGTTAGERFREGFSNAATRTTPFMNRDKPPLQSPTREEDMFYQSPLATTFTGVRKTAKRNALEEELVRLGIPNNVIAPSTGNRQQNANRNEALGQIVAGMVDVTDSTYQSMSDTQKKNFLIERFQSAREVADEMAMGRAEDQRKDMGAFSFTPFDKTEWGRLPARIRKEVNDDYMEIYGQTVEELGAFRQGTEQGKALRGRFN